MITRGTGLETLEGEAPAMRACCDPPVKQGRDPGPAGHGTPGYAACNVHTAASSRGSGHSPFKRGDTGSNPVAVTCDSSERTACSESVIRRWQAEIRRRLSQLPLGYPGGATRGGVTGTCRAHNPGDGGSSPPCATRPTPGRVRPSREGASSTFTPGGIGSLGWRGCRGWSRPSRRDKARRRERPPGTDRQPPRAAGRSGGPFRCRPMAGQLAVNQ